MALNTFSPFPQAPAGAVQTGGETCGETRAVPHPPKAAFRKP